MISPCRKGGITRSARKRGLTAPAVRSYRQIAAILSERGGAPICPAHVRRLCRAAEGKLALALLSDPMFTEWCGPGLAPVRERRVEREPIVRERVPGSFDHSHSRSRVQ